METINTIGRRKSSVARIYLKEGTGKITINNREFEDYFTTLVLQNNAKLALITVGAAEKFDIKANIQGGGYTGQSDALKLAIARALVKVDTENNKKPIKTAGLLTRDPREVERKKPGRAKARKRFQFSKR